MSFKVLVRDPDGGEHVIVHEIDDKRVTRVGLVTRTGEAGAAKVDPDMTEVLLEFEYAVQDGRLNLQDIEALDGRTLTGDEALERIDRQAALPSATNSGLDLMLTASQQEAEEAEEAAEPAPAETPVDDGHPTESSQEPVVEPPAQDPEAEPPASAETPAGGESQSESDQAPSFGDMGG